MRIIKETYRFKNIDRSIIYGILGTDNTYGF